jgi:hypothetical protein
MYAQVEHATSTAKHQQHRTNPQQQQQPITNLVPRMVTMDSSLGKLFTSRGTSEEGSTVGLSER